MYPTAGIVNAGRAARSAFIPKRLSIRKIALTVEADELYPRAIFGDAPTGVVCWRALIPAYWPNKTIAIATQVSS